MNVVDTPIVTASRCSSHDLKRWRAFAMGFEKTSRNYLAVIQLVCSMTGLRDLRGGLTETRTAASQCRGEALPEVRRAYMLVRPGEFGIESVTDSCTTHTIEDELAIARRALGQGDLGHAAFHIATALATDPRSAAAVAVFDGWYAACDNALGLVTKRQNENWEGWFAMRARVYAKLGRSEGALPLLAKLAAAAPEKAYLSWLPLIPNPSRVSGRLRLPSWR